MLQFEGPDAEALLNKLFTRDVSKLKVGRCGYGLACFEDGGMLVDVIPMHLGADLFWYVQADGDFYGSARAHTIGSDVRISDPDVFVSQVQGLNSLNFLEAASKDGLPEKPLLWHRAHMDLGGQEFIITKTGFSNDLGWEIYTEPHHDADALRDHLQKHGAQFGLDMVLVDASNPRRIEAGILNAGSDFNADTTPYDVGLGRFVDLEKPDFLGKAALEKAPKQKRLYGIKCLSGEPLIAANVELGGRKTGKVMRVPCLPICNMVSGLSCSIRPITEPAHQSLSDAVMGLCRMPN